MWFYFKFCAAKTPRRHGGFAAGSSQVGQNGGFKKHKNKKLLRLVAFRPVRSLYCEHPGQEVQKHLVWTSVRATFLTVSPCKATKTPWKRTTGRICQDLLIPVNRYWKKKKNVYFGDHQGQKGERNEPQPSQFLPLTELSHSSSGEPQFPFWPDGDDTQKQIGSKHGRQKRCHDRRKERDSSVWWVSVNTSEDCVLSCQWCCQRRFSPFIPSSAAFHMQSGSTLMAGLDDDWV